ncbi:MAG: hypothetical protein ACOX9C_09190 [Kiritimatiellia bacterium]
MKKFLQDYCVAGWNEGAPRRGAGDGVAPPLRRPALVAQCERARDAGATERVDDVGFVGDVDKDRDKVRDKAFDKAAFDTSRWPLLFDKATKLATKLLRALATQLEK